MVTRRPSLAAALGALLAVLPACDLAHGGSHTTADAGPDGPDGGPGPDAGPGTQTERSCKTTFTYAGGGTTVEVAGAWDWSTRTPLVAGPGGVRSVSLELAPGVWPYKLIVDGNWILDPAQHYRAYDGGVENSGVIVPDCHLPLLEVASFDRAANGATVRVRVSRGAGGPALAATDLIATRRFEFADTPAQLTLDGDLATISLAALPAGKHTLTVTATDSAGHAALPLVLPFWIEPTPFDWRGPLYMIMLDRFRDGDPSNDPAPSTGAAVGADYLGGDLRGVAQAIDDGTLDDLGVTTLWISPWIQNPTGTEDDGGHLVTGYHGYWPTRARAIDPRFGTEADLEALVTAAHRHGMRVLMDFVINHVHEQHEYFAAHPDWFRTGCVCGTPGCDWTEHRLDCVFHPYMPDVNWQNPDGGWQIIDDALWWLERYDLDGLRVDAVKHVEDLAILNLSASIHDHLEGAGTEVFLLGETAMGWNGDDLAANLPEYQTISRYVGEFALSGQFDFVLYHGVSYRVWATEEKSLIHADYWEQQSLAQYPQGAIMTPFIGSHDSSRFVSLAEAHGTSDLPSHKWVEDGLPAQPTADIAYQRTALGYVWLLGLPGAPLVYYGDEYGEYGGADPDNRHMWRPPAARNAREAALYQTISRMGRARRDHVALRDGDYRTVLAEETFLVYARETTAPGEIAFVVLNRGAAAVSRSIPVPAGVSSLSNALDPSAPAIPVSGGNATIDVPAMTPMLLVPTP